MNATAWTDEEITRLRDHAARRGVTIVPEFDGPGHVIWALGHHPELATDEMRARPALFRYLDPAIPATRDFVRTVLGAMADGFDAAVVHIGGDEALTMTEAAFADFIRLATDAVHARGKTVVAWQEAIRGGLEPGDIMQQWMSPKQIAAVKEAYARGETPASIAELPAAFVAAFVPPLIDAEHDVRRARERGVDILLSHADLMYLDTQYIEPSADPAQEAQRQLFGLPAVVYGHGTCEQAYDWDPVALYPEVPRERIVGIEAAMWGGGFRDEADVFFQLLPRLAGIAEKAWADPRPWAAYRSAIRSHGAWWDALGYGWFRSSCIWEAPAR